MTNKISVVVSMLCEETPKVMNLFKSFDIFIALEVFSRRNHRDKNLLTI
jgi:hypothetical protein